MKNSTLVEDNLNLVYFLINKHYPTFIKDEDIVQVGMLALCTAANNWDETKSKFSTYASKCILNAIANEFRERSKHKHTLSLDYSFTNDEGESVTFGECCVGEEDVCYIDIDPVYERLTAKEREVIRLYRQGLSVNEIANKVDYGTQTVYRIIRKFNLLGRNVNGSSY